MVNRKAQGMSLNMIIGLVIALIVLIVVIAIFTGKAKWFSQSAASCESKGGTCETGTSCTAATKLPFSCGEGQVCCYDTG